MFPQPFHWRWESQPKTRCHLSGTEDLRKENNCICINNCIKINPLIPFSTDLYSTIDAPPTFPAETLAFRICRAKYK